MLVSFLLRWSVSRVAGEWAVQEMKRNGEHKGLKEHMEQPEEY